MAILRAENAALVAEIQVVVGDLVAAGTVVLTTELMKMRHDLRAPIDGRVTVIHVSEGAELAGGEALVSFENAEVAAVVKGLDEGHLDMTEFKSRMKFLSEGARADAVAKRYAEGFRTARANIDDLFDEGSFVEYGALAVAAQRSKRSAEELQARTQGDGIICGVGKVAGRPVAAMAVDYMVLAGTQGFYHHKKMDRLIEVAGRDGLPIILFAEGGGGRPNDYDVAQFVTAGLNITSFRHFAAHRGPKIGIVAGYCFAGNAAMFGVCDVRIATENSYVGMGGPAMIEGGGLGAVKPTEIGPSNVQAKNGVHDLVVFDEAEGVAAAKQLLGLSVAVDAGEGVTDALREIVPVDRTKAYDMRSVVEAMADQGSWLELRRGFGAGMITGFARINGRAIGVLANNPLHLGGAIDAEAGDKGARFIQLCDAWGLPLLTLCDTPGFMVAPEVEITGQVAHVSRLFLAGAHFGQPLVTIILRKGYGLGAMAMAGGGFDRPHLCVAWPTGEVGAMGLEGAVRLGNRDHLAAIENESEREKEYQRLVDRLYEKGKALNAASQLEFDAVIDPGETRDLVDRAFATAGVCVPSGRYVDGW